MVIFQSNFCPKQASLTFFTAMMVTHKSKYTEEQVSVWDRE